MSTQDEVNAHPYEYILYYCNSDQKDATVYDIYLSNVCSISYDGSDNLIISNWQIGGYSAPSNTTLKTFVLATVLAWYDNFYIVPLQIKEGQSYLITASKLASIRSDSTVLGCVVLDTTNNVLRTWNGSSWITGADRFVCRDGSNSMSGNLNVNSKNVNNTNILNYVNVDVAPSDTPSGGYLYVEGGALKYKGSSGTVTTLAPA